MSSQATALYADQHEQFQPYRAVSKAAVVSLILGFLSLAGLLAPVMLVLPLIGIIFGAAGYFSVRRYPNELTGATLAKISTTVCLLLFVGGAGFHGYVYATEVPDGYERITFYELKPREESPELPFAPEALELDGKKVFVKGYVYPDGQQTNIRQFVLVPDMGTCCFGGQPALTDMIQVTLKDPHRVSYSRRQRKLGGILRVDSRKKPVSGLDGVYFQLEADYVQ